MLELQKTRMKSYGRTIGESLKYQSDMIMNETFSNDIGYRQIFIQVDDSEIRKGEQWFEYNHMKWVKRDAKYSTHGNQSIVADHVDYYLQFRPMEHHSIGRYVIVPNDTTYEPNIDDKSQWWLIVGRDNTTQFVQYNILQCNWNFQWIADGVVYECFAPLRNLNSYTSGQWTSDMTTTTDNIIGAWLPDNEITQTIDYDIRFMLSRNKKHPKVFKASKILDTFPQGIIKLTFKQDFEDGHHDVPNENGIGGLCDYDITIKPIEYEESIKQPIGTSVIKLAKGKNNEINIGSRYWKYYTYTAYDNSGEEVQIIPEWNFVSVDNDKFTTEIDGDGYFRIKAEYDVDLIGSIVTIQVKEKDSDNYYSELQVEVKA